MAYTLQDLISAVQDDLHDTSFNTTRITRYLNYGQLQIFNTHMFRFCQKALTTTVDAGVSTKALPADHQATIGGSFHLTGDSSIRFTFDQLNYLPHRDFFDIYPDASIGSAGLPAHWTEYGVYMYFDTVTDQAYDFTHFYYRVPTTLSASGDVPDVPEAFRELLELYAVHRAEKYRGNHDVAATYLQEFEDGLESMVLRYAGTTQVAPARMRQTRGRSYLSD